MIWLVVAILALVASVMAQRGKADQLALVGRLVFFLALMLWILSEAGDRAFQGSETSLLGWFVIGLALFSAGEIVGYLGRGLGGLSLAGVALAALSFAAGFDVLRPDDYALVPALLVGAMVVSVAARAFVQFAKALRKKGYTIGRVALGLYMLALTVMVYSAVFKVIDRGWALPWAYLAGGGALVFAAGQLWSGTEKLLMAKGAPEWVQRGAMGLGQLMMVVAAVFVYREFL